MLPKLTKLLFSALDEIQDRHVINFKRDTKLTYDQFKTCVVSMSHSVY